MPRRKINIKREMPLDRVYHAPLVGKFINCVMWQGKKATAELIVYGAIDYTVDKTKEKEDPLQIFNKAMANVMPSLEVKSRRIGGANYQVPLEVPEYRRIRLAIRWMITAARARKGKCMAEKLGQELLDAAKGEGAAFKKKEDTHRMAEANKAFAHFRY
ncbi:MAG: 30S ribosomal protein S7 [Candidatus Wallbacteria bacterium]|nr:30S ribosomal protein S7 [Candidatus Wallbacteria bacterium]